MAEEVINEINENQNYIDTIQQLKENTVDRAKYEKLMAENKQLLNTLVNGGSIEQSVAKKEVDIPKLTDEILFGYNNNLEYWQKSLELRNALLEAGKPDPFISRDPLNPASENAAATAEKVAQVVQECIDYANGDNGVFTAELQRRTVDPVIVRR